MATNRIPKLSKNCKDITGQRFSRLVAIEPIDRKSFGKIVWRCICDCGNETFVTCGGLNSGTTQSCGCLQKDVARKNMTTHGFKYHPLYRVWENMKTRCYNSKRKQYRDWGGRGIKVCDEWLNDPKIFIEWGLANGWKNGLSIERKNNDGNYKPKNCTFATAKEQSNNQRPKSCGPQKQFWFRAWHKDMMCQFISNNQSEFARQWMLFSECISLCLMGKQKQHKGWCFARI